MTTIHLRGVLVGFLVQVSDSYPFLGCDRRQRASPPVGRERWRCTFYRLDFVPRGPVNGGRHLNSQRERVLRVSKGDVRSLTILSPH